jgi:hypothetical protein
MTPFDSSPAPDLASAQQTQPGLRGFLNSRNGKLVVGIALGLLLLGVLGYIGFTFFMDNGSGGPAVPPVVKAPVTAPVSANAPAGEPENVPIEDVFTFRDIFMPTIKVSDVPSSTVASGTSGSSTQGNTLTLTSIGSENGAATAVLSWNGHTYTLAEGESIPNTPWRVLQIGTDSVTMLYGDNRITLSVGQGITK